MVAEEHAAVVTDVMHVSAMLLQVILVESLRALVALVRCDVTTDSMRTRNVNLQIEFVSRDVRTVFATVRLTLRAVHRSLMLPQNGFRQQDLATNVTRESNVICVTHNTVVHGVLVCLQLIDSFEEFVANVTLVDDVGTRLM